MYVQVCLLWRYLNTSTNVTYIYLRYIYIHKINNRKPYRMVNCEHKFSQIATILQNHYQCHQSVPTEFYHSTHLVKIQLYFIVQFTQYYLLYSFVWHTLRLRGYQDQQSKKPLFIFSFYTRNTCRNLKYFVGTKSFLLTKSLKFSVIVSLLFLIPTSGVCRICK